MTLIKTTTIDSEGDIKTQDHDLENATEFTVIVHQPGIKVEVPTFVEINGETTVKCMKEMGQGAWKWISEGTVFQALWKEAFQDSEESMPIPKDVKAFEVIDLAASHVAGMIVLGTEAFFAGKNVFFRNPETHLHPKTERCIVSMMKKMQEFHGGNGNETATAVNPETEPVSEKVHTLKWLECVALEKGMDKPFAKLRDTTYTIGGIMDEVSNETEAGQEMIDLFVKMRDGK